MSTGKKIPTEGGQSLGQNPFAGLSGAGLPSLAKPAEGAEGSDGRGRDARAGGGSIRDSKSGIQNSKNRGRVDVRRETGGRGGKTVTVVGGFTGIGGPEKEQLARKMRAACGCGGTVKDGAIEIQGDQRETVARILREAGFRPVFAGG